jgi:putative endonuclease
LQQREDTHNAGKGAKYTRSRRPIKIVYFEEFASRADAMRREAQVKKWKKEEKEQLIQKFRSAKKD